MSAEIKELMERIDPTHEKILYLSQKCHEFMGIFPNQVQKLVEIWSKTMESSPQKLSLLFLCNDLLQSSPSEALRSLFQFSLSRAFSIASSDPTSLTDIRKLLRVWGDCQLFSRQILEDWEKICQRAEQMGSRSDRNNFLHIISVGKKMKVLKNAIETVKSADREEKIRAVQEEHRHREELIREIVACMKKVYHGHLNITICLQRINEKLNTIDEVDS